MIIENVIRLRPERQNKSQLTAPFVELEVYATGGVQIGSDINSSRLCFIKRRYRLRPSYSNDTRTRTQRTDIKKRRRNSCGVGRWWQKNHHLLSRQARPYHHSRSRSLRYNKRPPVKRSPHSHSPPSSLAPRVILAVHGLGNQFDSTQADVSSVLCLSATINGSPRLLRLLFIIVMRFSSGHLWALDFWWRA